MKAADSIKAKLNATIGDVKEGAGANFKAAFAPLATAKASLESIREKLTPSFLADMQAGITTGIADLNNSVGSMTSSVTDGISAGKSAVADSINDIKSFAFAKFSSMTHPPHIQDILDKVNICQVKSEYIMSDAKFVDLSIPPITSDKIPFIPSTRRADTVPTGRPSILTKQQYTFVEIANANLRLIGVTVNIFAGDVKDGEFLKFNRDYTNYVQGLVNAAASLKADMDASEESSVAWRDINIPNYAELKQASEDAEGSDPVDQGPIDIYLAARSRIPGNDLFLANLTAYNAQRANILRLRAQLSSWRFYAYADAVMGPPW
jgi:hypothetical protein